MQADCCSDAFLLLNKELIIPEMTLTELSSTNPFNFNTSLGQAGLSAPPLPVNLPSFNF